MPKTGLLALSGTRQRARVNNVCFSLRDQARQHQPVYNLEGRVIIQPILTHCCFENPGSYGVLLDALGVPKLKFSLVSLFSPVLLYERRGRTVAHGLIVQNY